MALDKTPDSMLENPGGGGGGGTTDHGALTGLLDDDHPQYLTEARGGAVYYVQATVDSLLLGKKDDFTEKTAFNKDFGTTSGTIAQGSHTHAASAVVSGMFDNARIAESNVTQHVDALVHQSLSGAGTNDHAALDAHVASASNPHVVTKAQVGLGNVEDLKVTLNASTDPTVNDDSASGYAVGSRWFNVSLGKEFVCLDATVGAAVWTETTYLGGAVESVFGRDGVVVAAASDYDASQIDNDSAVSGTYVKDALNTLNTDKVDDTDGELIRPRFALQSITHSASGSRNISFSGDDGFDVLLTLDADITTLDIDDPPVVAGTTARGILWVVQGSGGGSDILAYDAGLSFLGNAPAINQTAGEITPIGIFWDGSNWYLDGDADLSDFPEETDATGAVFLAQKNNQLVHVAAANMPGGTTGDSWSDPVDSDIIPDTDSTYDIGSTSVRFQVGYFDALNVAGNITVTGTVDGRDLSTDGTKLDGIEASADVTDAANVTTAGAVMKTTYNANTILAATTDDTPAPVTVNEQTIVGRITSGNITSLTAAQGRTLLDVVQNGVGTRKRQVNDLGTKTTGSVYFDVGDGEVVTITNGGGPWTLDLDNAGTNWDVSGVEQSVKVMITANASAGAVTITGHDQTHDGNPITAPSTTDGETSVYVVSNTAGTITLTFVGHAS